MALRKWMVGLTSALVLGALGVAACGGDDNNGGPGGGDAGGTDATNSTDATQNGDTSTVQDSGVDATAAETAACQSVVDAICSKEAECGVPYELRAGCETAKASCPGPIFGGGSTMTIDQANACSAQMATLSCQDAVVSFSNPLNAFSLLPLRMLPACAVPGSRGAGDSCEWSTQCASLLCSSPEDNIATLVAGGGTNGKCGTCATTFGPTDDCTTGLPAYLGGSVCPTGQLCDTTAKRCRTVNAGDPCYSGICAYGDACGANPDGGAEPICAQKPAIGSPCSSNPAVVPCAGNGYCTYGDDAHDDGGTCTAPIPSGGICTPTVRAQATCAGPTDFCLDLDGGANAFCTTLPGDGQPCLAATACNPGSFCDKRVVGKETCRSPLANGSPCGTFPQTFADGGPTGGTAGALCAGACSTTCAGIPDSGVTGTCIGGPAGGQGGESCGTAVCTTCTAGSNCVSGKCEVATLHCE